jgi:hypothetical protein
MNRKLSMGLAAALGLTALVMTAFAQDSADRRNDPLVQDPALVDYRVSSDVVTNNGFAYISQEHRVTADEVRTSAAAEQLARQLGQTKSDDDKEKIKTKLAELLNKQFDLRQRRHESEIEALEAHVKKLKDLVRLRNDRRRDIVTKRLEQMVQEAEGLGW